MQQRVLITGNSSGLGLGLSRAYLERGWTVYGISRRGVELDGDAHHIRCDLSDFDAVPVALAELLNGVERLDLVILNAGVLGPIRDLHLTPLEEIRQVMEINTWSNKVIIDWLMERGMTIRQLVAISSGAGVNGNRGWGCYALSKAALNMLIQLYAHEFGDTHLTALAPGLVDTAMQDYLCEQADAERYPTMKRLRAARGTPAMPTPDEAGRQLAEIMPRLLAYPSGSYQDVRKLPAESPDPAD